ncbi:hypothetical protein NV377_08105 [Paenibacillus sp. T3-5-0-4]|nr:hypothetical protein [Paenibacillus endoradicis]
MLRTFSLDWCVLSAVVSAVTQRQDSIVFWSVHPLIRYPILAGRRAHEPISFSNSISRAVLAASA